MRKSHTQYDPQEEPRHMHQGRAWIHKRAEIEALMDEASAISSNGQATAMMLERARSIHLELAMHHLHAAGNLEHVIWEFGGHLELNGGY